MVVNLIDLLIICELKSKFEVVSEQTLHLKEF